MKHSLVKSTIVETASRLFYANGYNLTGINEIIKEAGIAKATLYSHFRSKEEICVAYLEHRHEAFMDAIESYCQNKKQGKARVLGIFDFLKAFFDGEEFNGCWCLNTISELPKDNEIVRTVIQKHKRDFLEWVDVIVKDSVSDALTSQNTTLAKQIYLLYEGAVSESHLQRKSWPINSAKQMCEILINE